MKEFSIYSNKGGVTNLIERIRNKDLVSFKSYNDMIKHFGHAENINLKWYSFDNRIGFDVFMLTGNHSGYENQFLSFVIIN